jgi:DNA repair exonuclease SbcCD ATPase subunit
MKLEFIELAGFRGFRNKTRFDLPGGFTVLSGRNGSGKSTLLDAIDFAITGTINKFSVKEARGGGLDEHIWWVGEGKSEAHYVSVGFIADGGEHFVITRSRERGCDTPPQEILNRLGNSQLAVRSSVDTLMQTTLIRDELIAGLSLDLPEQARFAAVRAAIGGMVGPDYSERTEAILAAANTARNRQNERVKEAQNELGRVLGEITEARSNAERSAGISEALRVIESLAPSLPSGLAEKTEAVRRLIAERRLVLRELENARLSVEELQPELMFFNSSESQKGIELARVAQEAALREKTLADERLALALRLDAAERANDEYATHMSAILDHGAALGLHDGHCPLCDAVRSAEEFGEAISAAKERLADHGVKLAKAAEVLAQTRAAVGEAELSLTSAQSRYSAFQSRREALQQKLKEVQETYARYGFDTPANDAKLAQTLLFAEREKLVRLERALSVLEASNAIDRVKTLEGRITTLRERSDQEAAKIVAAEKAVEAARQIDASAKTVANQILTEQFDTVMPLLKELYRRLRPHANWTEIESDFGGKIRGSLNFTVGDGHNPQFLFSSGQRRAAGLAFLLAVHLSRPWCSWRSLLMDDPVQHIDDYRALNLVEVLTAIRRTGRQVIVAVEDVALANVLCRRLRSASGDSGRHFQLRTSKTGTAEIATVQNVYPMPRLVLRPAQAS